MDELKFENRIHIIAEELKKVEFKTSRNIGLLGGATGVALFYAHYAMFTKKDEDYDYAYQFIEQLVNNNSYQDKTFAYSYGHAGLGWLLEHLRSIDFLDVDTNELFTDIDPLLSKKMVSELKSYNYDFFHGGLGVLNYFLEKKNIDKVSNDIQLAIDALENISVKYDDYKGWLNFEYKSRETIEKQYNLGLAHGIPGILSILCKCYYKHTDLQKKLFSLIESVTGFLIHVYGLNSDNLNSLSFFDNVFNEGVSVEGDSRLGWCYGDLGVVLALYSANQILKHDNLEQIIDNVLNKNCKRRSIKENRIFDAGLCHGSVGVAHIFNQFFKRTDNAEFKEAADYWYNISLKQGSFPDGLAGFKAFDGENGYVDDLGFLGGISGIGLAYISLLTNNDSWDKSLLINC